jgi:hypothetical protein
MPRADIEIRFALLMLALAAILAFHDPSGAWDALTTAESEVVCSPLAPSYGEARETWALMAEGC